MLKAVLILPFNVLVIIPLFILYFGGFELMPAKNLCLWFLAFLLLAGGLTLMIWTMRLFAQTGSGSLAPWNPIKKLIISGPYAYVRNPMISGVFLFLGGECLLFQSLPLFCYLLIFITINLIYIPLVEEKGLQKRYERRYLEYKKCTPRFLPKLIPSLKKKKQKR